MALPGIDRRRIRRGHALVAPNAFPRSYRLDIALEELQELPADGRVTVHHGTAELSGRVVRAGERWAQLRLFRPVVAARGDHVVLRTHTTAVNGASVLVEQPAWAERIATAATVEDLSALWAEGIKLGEWTDGLTALGLARKAQIEADRAGG